MIGKCSLVIRAYNEARHLPRLFEGIRQQSLQEVETILVDSGSTDQTISLAQGYGAKIVHIRPQEFTFGRSLNLGIAACTHDLVAIASAHVYPVYPDWLERLLEPFSDSAVALTYGKQRGAATTKYSERQIFAHWFPDAAASGLADHVRQSHPFCNNANAAIRRSLWQEHPYDESLTGLEDLAWAKWALERGYGLVYVPSAEVIHVHNETPRGVYNRYRREGMAFKRIFPESHFNVYDFVRLTITNIASDLYHAAREGLLAHSLPSIFWFRFMQFWGTYQGYRQSGPLTQQLRQTFYYPRGMQTSGESRRDVEPIRYNR